MHSDQTEECAPVETDAPEAPPPELPDVILEIYQILASS